MWDLYNYVLLEFWSFFKNKLQKYSDNVILENSFRFAGKIELDLLFWPFYFHPIHVKKYFWTMTILNWNSWFQKFSLVKNFSRLTFSVGNNYQLKERLGSYKKIVWCRVALLHVLNDMRKKICVLVLINVIIVCVKKNIYNLMSCT